MKGREISVLSLEGKCSGAKGGRGGGGAVDDTNSRV